MSSVSGSSPRSSFRAILPRATRLRLLLSWAVVAAFHIGGPLWLEAPIATPVAIVSFMALFSTILIAAFGVVREADHLAQMLGEPYGTLILTLSIVAIEVILIVAVMIGPGQSDTIGRDSIFAVMMIIMNLVTGLCLLLGGLRHGEQEYNSQGAVAYLSMIVVLTGTALVLPNVASTGDGTFAPGQAAALTVLTVVLYAAFLAMQTRGYRRFFVQPDMGSLAIPLQPSGDTQAAKQSAAPRPLPDKRAVLVRSIVLIALILPIVLLAQDLAILIDLGIEQAGAPVAIGGLLIAIIVFTPEAITAVKAALADEMQRAINLCLGAFVSTVGLTVPAVLAISLIMDKAVVLGLNAADTVLLVLTVALTTLTFLGLRTSPVQGMMHLALFAVFALLLFVP